MRDAEKNAKWRRPAPVAGQARTRPDKPIVTRRRTLPSTGFISSKKDLDKARQEHPEPMAAMQANRNNIINGSKKIPNKMVLSDG